ncbi:hypothetical protein [Acidisphaera sp. S103]|uniref:hypothetical protein n=1 Tax=Acidisphaera sp. S103 TaxID=1747223 RepID=UPI00131BFCFF|nr:hypothetical protein [Acidisphaera sp. S103]
MIDADILFKAIYRGKPVSVTHASDVEIESVVGTVGPPQDMLELWSFIAIRIGSAVDIHALACRVRLRNTWITSSIVAVDLTARAIRTWSGQNYLLGTRDEPELDPELRAHLAYALRTWGFTDVVP